MSSDKFQTSLPRNHKGYDLKVLSSTPFDRIKLEEKKAGKKLDFKILGFSLVCSNLELDSRITYNQENAGLFYNDDFYVNSFERIVQVFNIEIFPQNKINPFKFAFKSNSDLTILKAVLKYQDLPESDLKQSLLDALYKSMIRHNILILRLDKNLNSNIDKCLELIKQDQANGFEFMVSSGVNAIQSQEAKIVLHKKPSQEEEIAKDVLVFEYLFKKEGKKGRNLKGELIEITKPKDLVSPSVMPEANLHAITLFDRIQYFSTQAGFFTKDNAGYKISPSTTQIQTSQNLESKKELDPSSVFNDFLEGDTFYIDIIENSKILAKNVYIKKCKNSTIEAENIYIEQLFSDNKIFPKKNLIIEKSIDSNNAISVRHNDILDESEQNVDEFRDILENLNFHLKKIMNNSKTFYDYLTNNQARIIQLKKNPPKSDLEKKFIENYSGVLNKYNAHLLLYKRFVKLKFALETKIDDLRNFPYNARIYIQAPYMYKDNVLDFHLTTGKVVKAMLRDKGLYSLSNINVKRVEIDEKSLENLKESIKNSTMPSNEIQTENIEDSF